MSGMGWIKKAFVASMCRAGQYMLSTRILCQSLCAVVAGKLWRLEKKMRITERSCTDVVIIPIWVVTREMTRRSVHDVASSVSLYSLVQRQNTCSPQFKYKYIN